MRKIFAVSTRNSAETSAQPENWRSILQLFGSSDMKNDSFFLVSSPLVPPPSLPLCPCARIWNNLVGGLGGTVSLKAMCDSSKLQGPETFFAYFVKPLQDKGELQTYRYLPSDIPPYTSADDGTWSSKPLTLESKAQVASNLHQMLFHEVYH